MAVIETGPARAARMRFGSRVGSPLRPPLRHTPAFPNVEGPSGFEAVTTPGLPSLRTPRAHTVRLSAERTSSACTPEPQ